MLVKTIQSLAVSAGEHASIVWEQSPIKWGQDDFPNQYLSASPAFPALYTLVLAFIAAMHHNKGCKVWQRSPSYGLSASVNQLGYNNELLKDLRDQNHASKVCLS